jgi:hypothetical protein
VARSELEALLAGLADSDVGGQDPKDLVELLSALGLNVDMDETTGLKVVKLAQGRPPDGSRRGASRLGMVGLDTMLEHMNAEQLKQVAKRFHPEANASRVVESRRAVLEALGSAALLNKMIDALSPLERALLSEVKRRGGAVDGWALIVYAALHDFEPVVHVGGSVYKDQLNHAPGIGYLGVLLRDGLLIPASNHAPWFVTPHLYGSERDAGDDLVFVDPRVLMRLPDEPSPSVRPLELEPLSSVTPSSNHPLQSLLELFEAMQLILEEGGLQITQSGRVSKPLLARLSKRRPWLEVRLDSLLQLGLSLGLLEVPENSSAKDPWRVNSPLLRKLKEAPLAISYAFMVEAFLDVAEIPAADSGSSRQASLISKAVAGRALLESLELLADHPVGMEEALEGLWQRALKYLFTSPRMRYRVVNEDTEPERPIWFTDILLGTFRDLGLIAVAERLDVAAKPSEAAHGDLHVMRDDNVVRFRSPSEGDTAYRYVVMPALGLSWLAQGRQLQRAEQPPELEQLRRLLGLNPDTGKPDKPSLLIQPNFDILVYLDELSPLALIVLSCADCHRIDAQTASYTITRSSLYRALETGLELHTLLELLQEHSMGVPDNVAHSLRDWASRRERLRVRDNVKLLEYADQKERDAALDKLKGARGLAERFILLDDNASPPKVEVCHQYSLAPTRTLRFHPEGYFRLEGATDLAGRAVLAQLATQDSEGRYHLEIAKACSGALTTAARDTLAARAQGGLPPQLEVLMNIWAGKNAAPALATISVFQHPSATALAKHPRIARCLDKPLNDTSYLVKKGQERQLEQILSELGLTFTQGFMADIKPQVTQGSMQRGLDTRKMRVMIETTISEGRSLELHYHRENVKYDDYGYTKKSKGKLITERVTPEAVMYSGSTPYLTGKTLSKSEHRYIRIGYIAGIAVL